MLLDISEKDKKEISNIRARHETLYSDMDRFTVQVILTYRHHSPMSVEDIHKITKDMNYNLSKEGIALQLKELVKYGLADEKGQNSYEPTKDSYDILRKEGITKEYLFERFA